MSVDWRVVANNLMHTVKDATTLLDDGQRASLSWLAKRLPQSGVVLADEVGTGKTRIACAVVHAVLKAGGRAAVVVPHGLMHQWQSEAHVLGMPTAKSFTSVFDFIKDTNSKKWEEIAPAPDMPEWMLVSHRFRAPQVNKNSTDEWRIALPSYVRAVCAPLEVQTDRRTLEGRLLSKPDNITLSIAKEIARWIKAPSNLQVRNNLNALPHFRREGDNTELIEVLQGCGRNVIEELLGGWLGEFDLLVVDEAHKSRGEGSVEDSVLRAASGTLLTRLVDNVLKQPESGRRLCLTATPMELELSQWLDLLDRARSGLNKAIGKEIVEEFQSAAHSAAIAADEGGRLDRLAKASKRFEKGLDAYVTRRRRDDDRFIVKFREAAVFLEERPHQHRRIKCVPIAWPEMMGQRCPSWPDVLFAAECMSQSARGLKQTTFERALQFKHAKKTLDEKKQKRLKHLIRDLYARIASGHLSADIVDNDVQINPPDGCDDLVIPPFLTGLLGRTHAARFSFCAGVIPPMPIFGRSLLYVQSHFVA